MGGRNINRRKPREDWRWINHGTMIKMSYFAFGKGQPSGTFKSADDCMIFFSEDGYKFHDANCGPKIGGYICEF